MNYSARALLFSLGLREKSHAAIFAVLEDQCLNGKLEGCFLDDYRAAITARENADYHYTYSEEAARQLFEAAEGFLDQMRRLVK